VLRTFNAQCVDATDVDLPTAGGNIIGRGDNPRKPVTIYDQPERWLLGGECQLETRARTCDRELVRLAVN
jgi:hypothetical protein